MAEFKDETNRVKVAESRHNMVSTVAISLFLFLGFSILVSGCTYYNVKKLETPVQYEHNENIEYKRGGQ